MRPIKSLLYNVTARRFGPSSIGIVPPPPPPPPPPVGTISAPVLGFAVARVGGETFDFTIPDGTCNITLPDITITSGMYWEVEIAANSGFTTPLSGEGSIRTETLQIGAMDFITGPEFVSCQSLPNGPTYMRLRVSDDSARVSAWSNTLFDTISLLVASTLDPAKKDNFMALSGGNMTVRSDLSSVGAMTAVRSTNSRTGKYFFTVLVSELNATGIGVGVANSTLANANTFLPSNRGNNAVYWDDNRDAWQTASGVTGAYGTAPTVGQRIMVAFDNVSANKVWFGLEGTWFSSSNPVTNTGGFAVPSGALFALLGVTARNTGQSTLVFEPSPASWLPSGFTNLT